MPARQRLMQTPTVRSSSPHRSRALPWTVALHPDLPALLRKTTPATRARLMLDLQRTVGNAAARELLTEPPRSSPTVHGGGPSVSLHGDTTADYDGGSRGGRRNR